GPPAVRNIPVPLTDSCNLLTVDIATWRLRPCFNSSYTVNYCNYSSQTIEDTYVEVALDSLLAYTASSIPGTLVSGNTYRFETGDLPPGVCGQFTIQVLVDCEAPVGLTHCTEAHIFPTDYCPAASPWSGANLRVTGYCEGDSVRLQIKNIGMGAMAQSLDFVVTEDLIMAKTAPFQLGAGGTLTVSEPSNGSTWRLETPQEPGHPWGGVVATVVEGCGGLNTPGLVNIFPVNDNDPFSSTDCTENTSSYDPNDKQAFPTGYGTAHFIRANTDIEYLIRFQNTGTDTAFTVVLLDTLSSFLDASKVRPGAASHAYDFDVLGGNVLRFRFDHILLPDSNVNEAASHGFVKFRVPQQVDNPIGTLIENRAGIYFDFNDPVMTNTTWHTISDEFILVSTDQAGGQSPQLRVYPNPGAEAVFFELPEPDANRQLWLMDALGTRVAQRAFPDAVFRFERGQLPTGVYFYSITAANGLIASGKIVLN
ncbi:MAG: T9SS type A sorting domain-containing protein, partial [Saprospiraceae bacterium]|nr:T9SS type A sorting domain-containing protein [Saprospiraceae bacterium]